MVKRPRPTYGLNAAERRVFWHLMGAVGDVNSSEVDLDAHCRDVARTVAWHQLHPSQRKAVR